MEKEEIFRQTLQKLRELAGEQGGVLSEEQLRETFGAIDFPLNETNLSLVKEYLNKSGIGIGEPMNPEDYLTEQEVDYLNQYLEEVKQLEALSDGEREAVTLSAMAGDKDAQNRLVEIYLPYVAEVAKLYAGQGVYLEDLVGEGNVALAMGVSMLDCLEKPAEVQGMLGNMMMQAMEEYIRDNAKEDKTDQKILKKVNHIAQLAEEVAADLGRKVTPQELADEKQLTLKEIYDAMRISGNQIEDLEITGE